MAERPGSRKRLYGYTPKPQCKKMEGRERSIKEYHSNRWTVSSRKFREANPLCKICFDKGIIKPSEVTDHVIPVEIHKKFWDRANWQPLCKTCNIVKGNNDKVLIYEYRKANKQAN